MRCWLAAASEELSAVSGYTHIARASYHIGTENRLMCHALPPEVRGGLLMLSNRNAPPLSQPLLLCRRLLQECRIRGYQGIVLDFEGAVTDDKVALVRLLDANAPLLFVPESYGSYTQRACVLICTALSGGSLQQRLTELPYPPQRLALDCQRSRMVFPLPCPDGVGRPITPQELQQHRTQVFFSEPLCARYYTYQQSGSTRFVLFDDAETLRKKVELGEQLGIQTAFFMLPEVRDILEQLPLERA